MVKIDRSFVLKSFLDKVYDAKRQNMSEVRMSVKELDNLAYVIYQLMSEDMAKVLEYLENSKPKEEVVVKKQPPKRIVETIKVNKVQQPKIIEPKEEIVVEKIENDVIVDEYEEDEEQPYLYGGTF